MARRRTTAAVPAVTLLAVTLTVAAALTAAPAAALSCAGYALEDRVRMVDVIYVGRVVKEISREKRTIDYRMEVLRTIKGARRDHRVLESYGIKFWSDPPEFDPGTRILVVDNSIGICAASSAKRVSEKAERYDRVADRLAGRSAAPHVVEAGEWLWSIARDRLTFDRGDPTRRQIHRAALKIYDENRARIGGDPDDLQPGMTLRIPKLR